MMEINTNTGPGAIEYPALRYSMGFAVNGEAIPDCAVFTGKESDLDTMGERDATGYLHRKKVATKFPLKLEYHAIPVRVAEEICDKLRHDKFQFRWFSLYHGGFYTMDAYVGDRDFEAVWWPEGGTYLVNLTFSVIEY